MKAIVATTISPPTEALIRFSKMTDWTLFIVGDVTTPHASFRDLNCVYLSPDDQDRAYPELSAALGWRTITRRNLGFLEAFHRGAEIIATVDDDNLPLAGWGENLLVGQTVSVACFETELPVLDPVAVAPHDCLDPIWHRGFPHAYVGRRHEFSGPTSRDCTIHVQASLWNGQPDIDAVCRTVSEPSIRFRDFAPFSSPQLIPFNSQNCFLSRTALPYYMMLSGVGRGQDVLGAYVLQHFLPGCVAVSPPTVTHCRNAHDVYRDLEEELVQYRITKKLVDDISLWRDVLPASAVANFDVYRRCFER